MGNKSKGHRSRDIQESSSNPPPSPSPSPDAASDSEAVVYHEQSIGFSGPLPLPQLLVGYEEVSPGAAAIILEDFQKQGAHRREMESRTVEAGIQNNVANHAKTRRGQTFAFIITILGLGAAVLVTLLNHETVGGILVGSTMVGLASAFQYSRHPKDRRLHGEQPTRDTKDPATDTKSPDG